MFSRVYIAELEKEENMKEMLDWFEKRTKMHIDLVKKYCNKIDKYDHDKFNGIIERGEQHDASKYEEPEKTPYIYISWQYKCKESGKEFEVSDDMKQKMTNATEHHVHSNRHHPEYHSDQKETINREDRDKPVKLVDATKMTDLDIAENVADWCAMSEEKKSNPKDWADKNIGKRWKYTDEQKKLIYELIGEIFNEKV